MWSIRIQYNTIVTALINSVLFSFSNTQTPEQPERVRVSKAPSSSLSQGAIDNPGYNSTKSRDTDATPYGEAVYEDIDYSKMVCTAN